MAITLSIRHSLDVMANLTGCAQGTNAGLGSLDGELCLSRMSPLAGGDAQGREQDQKESTPKQGTTAKFRYDARDKASHGVRPVR